MENEPNQSQTLKRPVSHIIPAGTTEIVSFINEFLGEAEAIIISNLDSSNICTFQINGDSNPILTLASGADRSIDKTIIKTIKIVAGAAGAVQLEAQIRFRA